MSSVKACPTCGLPVDKTIKSNRSHKEYCVGETPYVLHNQRAGMVVYLTEEEHEAMRASNADGAEFPDDMAKAIANRAVFGITP